MNWTLALLSQPRTLGQGHEPIRFDFHIYIVRIFVYFIYLRFFRMIFFISNVKQVQVVVFTVKLHELDNLLAH